MKEIYLIRHGRQDITAFNEDVPLSERGIKQALLLKERLKDEKYDKIYSSTLKRAMETVDIINENWHLDIERRKELGEIDYGVLTSLPLEVKEGEYKAFFSELEKRESDLPFPGGENSSDVWKRAQPVFREIENSSYSRILIVCHGGMIRATLLGLLSLPMTKRLIFSKHLENTSITKLLYDEKSNLYYLETLNDHAHLCGHSELLREF